MNVKLISMTTLHLEFTNHKSGAGNFRFKPRFSRRIGQIDPNLSYVDLAVEVGSEPKSEFPMEIKAQIRAVFSFDESVSEDERQDYLKKDAVDFVYPDLRSVVSGMTVAAMENAVFLPLLKAEDFNFDSPKFYS